MKRWLLVFALAGCTPEPRAAPARGPVAPPESPPSFSGAAAPAPVVDWSGRWETSWGPMELTQLGSTVTGTYAYDMPGAKVTGHLNGTVTDHSLDFAWDEPQGAGSGHGRFVMSSDGASFKGTWGKGGSRTDGGEWTGNRM